MRSLSGQSGSALVEAAILFPCLVLILLTTLFARHIAQFANLGSTIPILILYIFFQRYFVEGIAASGVKG